VNYTYDFVKKETFRRIPADCEFCVSGGCRRNVPALPGVCVRVPGKVDLAIFAKGSSPCPKPVAVDRAEGYEPTDLPIAKGTLNGREVCQVKIGVE
jgi:hypothetical protein